MCADTPDNRQADSGASSRYHQDVTEATKPAPKMTTERRIERRRLIAKAIHDGNTPAAVCGYFNVAMSLITRSCKEYDVPIPRRTPSPRFMGRTIKILARLLRPQPSETFATIASDLQIQRQRVDQVFKEAIEQGFRMERWGGVPANGGPRTSKERSP